MNKIFSFTGNVIMTVIVAIIVSLSYDLKTDLTIITVLFALFATMKINLSFFYTQGHGVGIKHSSKNFLKMPVVLIIFFVIVLGCTTALFAISRSPNDATPGLENMTALGLAMLLTVILAILRWYFSAYREMYLGSEYEARLEFKGKKYSNEEADIKIKQLREFGVLPKE